ncbi:MAG TPA: formyltransferase [Alphaproteobacteria bacterium]|nr:formyltransferase [Alphaproteobacteria bacterium]
MSAPRTPESAAGGIIVFAYSDIGYECLDLLIRRGEAVRVVFTHEDDPGESRWFRSVAELAQRHGIAVRFDEPSLGSEADRLIATLAPDLIFSFYYRRMIPTAVLAAAKRGAFNMHGSLLPKYRGKAPVNWAVLQGERETGVTLHHMVARADAGDIVDQEAVPIGPDDTAYDVMRRLVPAARRLLDRQLAALKAGTAPRRPQDEAQATRFGGRRPEDGRIDWTQPAARIIDLVRAVAKPYPGAFSTLNGRRLLVWKARAAGGANPGRPGEVLSATPLRIRAGDGALELIESEWADPGTPRLQPGDILG